MVTNNITVFISIFRPRRSYNHATYSMINYSYQIPKFTMNMHDIVSLYTLIHTLYFHYRYSLVTILNAIEQIVP